MQKKILVNGECSLLPTGFAAVSKNLCQGLHDNGFDVCELASYAHVDDPNLRQLPWRAIGNMPEKNNPSQEEVNAYNSKVENQWGEHRFNDVCLEFNPDVILDARDSWYCEYIQRSPFRDNFNFVYMPTCDSSPQNPEWIQLFNNTDVILAYSDWAKEVLLKQCGNQINFKGVPAVGIDFNIFKPPQNKAKQKANFGLREDIILVGTCQRNQRRKCFPELIEAFAKFLKVASKNIAERTFLYLHTSYPDVGWHIPTLLKEFGVSSKVLFTYICQNCKLVEASLFKDARSACKRCRSPQVAMPNCGIGVPTEILAEVYKMFDVYVQISTAEGLGVPVIEASACGVHPMVTNYSAMEDFVWKLGATPINVKSFVRESETHCYRASSDQNDLVNKLLEFLSLPEGLRLAKGYEAHLGAKQYYSWDRSVKVWIDAINSLPKKDIRKTWLSPIRIHQPITQLPNSHEHMSNEDFVRWAITNVLGRSELLNSYFELRLMGDLNLGIRGESTGGMYFNELSTLGTKPNFKQFNRQDAMGELVNLCNYYNHWEEKRYQKLSQR